MDGIHDLGGMQGFGRIGHTPREPAFHEPWEGRVHGMMVGLLITGNLRGSFRYAIERMDPAHYLTSSYYEHWLAAVETLLVESGKLAPGEIDGKAATLDRGAHPPERRDPSHAQIVHSLFGARARAVRETIATPRHAKSDRVRVRNVETSGHTRCPRYVRDRTGVVDAVHDATPLPDRYSKGDMRAEPYYTVVFDAAELWGEEAEAMTSVRIDLWESYLEAV